MSDILYYLGLIVVICLVPIFSFIIISIILVKRFPNLKVSSWIKKHIITDQDLE